MGHPYVPSHLWRGSKWLSSMDLAANQPGTGEVKDLAAQMLLSLALKEAVPKHDLYSHPLFSTLQFKPFRLAERPLASPFLNPITDASFEKVAPDMEPFFLCLTKGDSYQSTA